jgi:hypothetical protein
MPHRRRFLQAAAAAVAVPAVVRAGDPPAAPTAAQALTEYVRARFGEHLNAEQLKRVQGDVAGIVRTAEALRRIRLEHSEEPASVFIADVEE